MYTEKPLLGKHAFITGGSGGIGQAIAEALVHDGAAVTLTARNAQALQASRRALLKKLPEAQVYCITGDALCEDAVKSAVSDAVDHFGSLDICVPTVGGGSIRPLLTHSAKSFMEDIELNILSSFLAVRYCVPHMAKAGGGSVVLISPDAAKLAFPWLPAYCTAKAGLEGLTRQLAEELSRYNIRVNAVRPGLTRTQCTQAIFENDEVVREFAAQKPLGRLGEPSDIAAGVRYLAGSDASWVTGQSLAIEGGNELRAAADQGPLVEQIFGKDVWDKVLNGEDPGLV